MKYTGRRVLGGEKTRGRNVQGGEKTRGRNDQTPFTYIVILDI